MKLVEQTTK